MTNALGHLHAAAARRADQPASLPATVYTFRVGADGTPSFPFVSPACAALYGFTAEDAMDDAGLMHDAVHPADRESFDAAGQRSLRTLRPMRWEGRIVAADGREVPVVIASTPRRLGDGSTEWHGAVVALGADDSDLPGTGAEVMSPSHADALSMLGHDLGAPLTAILGSAEWALEVLDEDRGSRRSDATDALLRRSLEVIERQGRRLNQMRLDLVTVAASDSGALVARPEPVDVLSCLQSAADLRRPDIDVRTTCPPDLQAFVQPGHLAQMLGNLVSNADRYARSRITLSASALDDRVRISVHDDGSGIPPEVAPRLFRRFSHLGATTLAAGAGTGLGLYIVRTLAEANGGTVLYAATDTGPCFTLALPAVGVPA